MTKNSEFVKPDFDEAEAFLKTYPRNPFCVVLPDGTHAVILTEDRYDELVHVELENGPKRVIAPEDDMSEAQILKALQEQTAKAEAEAERGSDPEI